MNRSIFTFLGLALMLLGASLWAQGPTASPGTEKVLRHMVVLKFKPATTPAQVEEVVKAFGDLEKQIPLIKGYEAGINNSPEKLDKGFTHCFLVTFHSEKDRDEYLKHTVHQAFVSKLLPVMEEAFVVDFWSKK